MYYKIMQVTISGGPSGSNQSHSPTDIIIMNIATYLVHIFLHNIFITWVGLWHIRNIQLTEYETSIHGYISIIFFHKEISSRNDIYVRNILRSTYTTIRIHQAPVVSKPWKTDSTQYLIVAFKAESRKPKINNWNWLDLDISSSSPCMNNK